MPTDKSSSPNFAAFDSNCPGQEDEVALMFIRLREAIYETAIAPDEVAAEPSPPPNVILDLMILAESTADQIDESIALLCEEGNMAESRGELALLQAISQRAEYLAGSRTAMLYFCNSLKTFVEQIPPVFTRYSEQVPHRYAPFSIYGQPEAHIAAYLRYAGACLTATAGAAARAAHSRDFEASIELSELGKALHSFMREMSNLKEGSTYRV